MQNENVGSLVQKKNNKEKVLLKVVLLKIVFLSSMFSVLSCHGVFYLLFNVLSREKLKILIIINFTFHLYIVQCQFKIQV